MRLFHVEIDDHLAYLGPVAPISVNCTVSWLTHFTLLLLADVARELRKVG